VVNLKKDVMAVAGIKIERTSSGVPKYVTIDLRKHTDLIPLLEEKGIKLDKEIPWTAKMKRSFAQAKNGDWAEGDVNNFWNV